MIGANGTAVYQLGTNGKMGLTEHRALKAFQEYVYPRLQSEIRYYAGFDVPIDIEWHSLAEDGMGHMYVANLSNVYFMPLIHALQQIAVDELGRNALRTNLQRIVIKNASDNFTSSEMATFEEGVLTIDHAPNSNVHCISQRVEELVRVLESHL